MQLLIVDHSILILVQIAYIISLCASDAQEKSNAQVFVTQYLLCSKPFTTPSS